MEQFVLRALSSTEGWDRYGSLFREDYFENSPPESLLFQAISRYWAQQENDEAPSSGALTAFVDSLEANNEKRYAAYATLEEVKALGLSSSLAVAKEALTTWRLREILTEAEMDLANRNLNPDSVAEQLRAVGRALHPPKSEALSLWEASKILGVEKETAKYTTGIPALDESLEGGLWGGELGVLIGKTFGGKTWTLVSFGAAALRAGIPVLHFTLEISRMRAAVRYYQNLLSRTRSSVIFSPEQVDTKIQSLGLPPWEILDFSSSGIAVSRIRREVENFINRSQKEGEANASSDSTGEPVLGLGKPLIIVDHLDLDTVLPNDPHLRERFALASATESLRQIAVEFEVGVWTAVQANRGGFQTEYIRLDHVAESLGVARKADTVLTLNQNQQEEEMGAMRIAIAKARERSLPTRVVNVKALKSFQRLEGLEV